MNKQSLNRENGTSSEFIQSFEKTATLKPLTPHGVPVRAMPSDENTRKRLGVAGIPILLLAAWAVTSCVGRVVLDNVQQKVGGTAATNAQQAKAVAGSFIASSTNDSITPDQLQFSELSAFSPQRKRYIGDWNVTYGDEAEQQYLIRLNAATRKIYAINRTQSGRSTSATVGSPGKIMSKEAAQSLAIRYLGRLGNDVNALRLEPKSSVSQSYGTGSYSAQEESNSYVFFYSRHAPGGKEHLLLVAIDQSSGGLSYYWNPSAAI